MFDCLEHQNVKSYEYVTEFIDKSEIKHPRTTTNKPTSYPDKCMQNPLNINKHTVARHWLNNSERIANNKSCRDKNI